MRNGIQESVSLQKLNTFGVQATAKSYVSITKESTLPDLYQQGVFSQPFFVLGGGSNVLFTQDYPGLIIHINNRGIQHFIEGNVAYVTAAGGEVDRKSTRLNSSHVKMSYAVVYLKKE